MLSTPRCPEQQKVNACHADRRRATDFVQVGGTRDGLDPYLDCARRRDIRAILVETPAFLRLRRQLGRRSFDLELAVENPRDPELVRAALAAAGVAPKLVLTGFETFVGSSFDLAARLGVAPWPSVGTAFRPLGKYGHRKALSRTAPHLPQPRFTLLSFERVTAADVGLSFPLVMKCLHSGAGVGVFFVDNAIQQAEVTRRIATTPTFNGDLFGEVLAEEYVAGREMSVQGIAYQGRPLLLSVIEKLVSVEARPWAPGLLGFRDVGYIVTHGSHAGSQLEELALACLHATGYGEGPFHVDAVCSDGIFYFLEIGFRLSGTRITSLVKNATGADWADFVFQAHLAEKIPELPALRSHHGVVGQIMATSVAELEAAAALAHTGVAIEVLRTEPFVPDDSYTDADRAALAADWGLLTGRVGQIIVTGDTVEEVRSVMQSLIGPHLTK